MLSRSETLSPGTSLIEDGPYADVVCNAIGFLKDVKSEHLEPEAAKEAGKESISAAWRNV